MRLDDLRPAPGATQAPQADRPRAGLRATARRPARGTRGTKRARAAARPAASRAARCRSTAGCRSAASLPHGGKTEYAVVNLEALARASRPTAWWTPTVSSQAGLIKKAGRARGEDPRRRATSAHALTVRAHAISESARAKIEARAAASSARVEVGRGVIEGLQSFQNVFKIPELKRRVLITAAACSSPTGSGAHVPDPGHRRPRARAVLRPGAGHAARHGRPLLGRQPAPAVDLRARASCRTSRPPSSCSSSPWSSRRSSGWPRRARPGARRSRSTRATARSCCRSSSRSASPTASRACGAPTGAVASCRTRAGGSAC